MKTETYKYPKSSFLSVEKDMGYIVNMICKNDRIKKLLYYTVPDALDREPLTSKQTIELMGKNIKIVPKLYVDKDVKNYILINFDNFTRNGNPEFRDNIIEFDIVCHYDQWQLRDFQQRPYRIAAELDTLFDNQHLSGIGELHFLGANIMMLTNEFAGICLMYQAVHNTTDDQKFPLNPRDGKDQIRNFDKIFNQK